jgi:hypothetical protein
MLPIGLTVTSSAACSAARGLPAVDLKNGLARADQRVHTQVAREAGVLQGGTVMLRQRLEQAFENQTAFRIGVFGLALAPVLMVLAVLFVDWQPFLRLVPRIARSLQRPAPPATFSCAEYLYLAPK